jgi:hypothetical protein
MERKIWVLKKNTPQGESTAGFYLGINKFLIKKCGVLNNNFVCLFELKAHFDCSLFTLEHYKSEVFIGL